MTSETVVTAAVLVIGDEILSGRTGESNIGTIARHLTAIGIRLKEARIVADDEAEIVAAVNALRARYAYLFTTGGIGPTHDDITADCIAKAFDVPIEVDPRAVALMASYYADKQLEFTPRRRRMARIPAGADLIENPISAAPGFMIDNVIVMAGIPNIMEAMLMAATPRLATGPKMLSVSLRLDHPESEIAALFAEHQQAHPEVAMGSYPHMWDGRFVTELVLRATDPQRLSEAVDSLRSKLSAHGFLGEF